MGYGLHRDDACRAFAGMTLIAAEQKQKGNQLT
jgi:hypothetical protein